MRGRRKRILAFLLALVLGISATDVSALVAESGVQTLQEEGTVSLGDSVSTGDYVSVGDSTESSEEVVTEVVFENDNSKHGIIQDTYHS